MGLTVHHLGVSQSERVVWLCEEIGLDYNLKVYKRSPLLAPADYKALHPIQAAPVIEDDKDGQNVKIAESEACLLYIDSVHNGSKLQYKPGEKGYADFLYWFTFTNGTLQSAAGRVMAMNFSGVASDNQTYQRYQAKVDQCFGFINDRLGESEFLGGHRFSLADCMVMFTCSTMRKFVPYDLTSCPNIIKYMERMSQRDGYKKAIQKGDPDLDVKDIIGAKAPEPFMKK